MEMITLKEFTRWVREDLLRYYDAEIVDSHLKDKEGREALLTFWKRANAAPPTAYNDEKTLNDWIGKSVNFCSTAIWLDF